MKLIEEEAEAGVFRADFQALQPWAKRVLRAPVVVDPFSVAQVLDSVMQCAQQRSVQGKVLVWNEYRVFLARADHEGLEAVAADISVDLERVLAKRLREMDGEIVGDRIYARLIVDEADQVRPGTAIVRATFLAEEDEVEAPVAGEMTVRFRPNAGGTELDDVLVDAPTDITSPKTGPTQRVDDPSPNVSRRPTVSLQWEGGGERLAVGIRYTLGRPHESAVTGFVSLTGASNKISRRHVWIEVQKDGVKIGRPSEANPVQVDGQLIPPGGEMYCQPPVTVSLSRGALDLCLEQIGV